MANAPEPVGSLCPDPAFTARFQRAVACLKKGAWEQAIAEYTEAIRLDPKAPNPYLGRAIAYRALGQEANAARDEGKGKGLGGPEKCAWDRLVNRAYQRSLVNLHPLEQIAVHLRHLHFQVINGGFPQWVQNGYVASIGEVMDAVKQIGTPAAHDVLGILRRVARDLNAPPPTEEGHADDLGELVDSTNQYYDVMGAFATDVETWLEEQVPQAP